MRHITIFRVCPLYNGGRSGRAINDFPNLFVRKYFSRIDGAGSTRFIEILVDEENMDCSGRYGAREIWSLIFPLIISSAVCSSFLGILGTYSADIVGHYEDVDMDIPFKSLCGDMIKFVPGRFHMITFRANMQSTQMPPFLTLSSPLPC